MRNFPYTPSAPSSPWQDIQSVAADIQSDLLYDLQPEHSSESAMITVERAKGMLKRLYALKQQERHLIWSRISVPLQQLSAADSRSIQLQSVHAEELIAMKTAAITSNVLRLAQQTVAEYRYIEKSIAGIVPPLEVNDPFALSIY